jgi:aspartate carbamoyltransferase catalytic subunit
MNHILTGKQFADKNLLDKLFAKAVELEQADLNGGMPKLLVDKVVATLFFESSTRTRLSFESAALRLGANIISVADAKTSSLSKGESIEDTVKVVSGYADAIVLRHPENGAVQKASQVALVPVINAGDGFNEHPTQALMDLWTMQKELDKIHGLKIAFLADMRYQRNIHSLASILGVYQGVKLYLIGPEELRLPEEYKQQLVATGVAFEELETLDSVLPEIDVLYVARVFKERFTNEADYERLKQAFFVDLATVAKMKQQSAILHVMPRVYEIDPQVDADPRAAYFRQAKNGLYIRSAVLLYALNLL